MALNRENSSMLVVLSIFITCSAFAVALECEQLEPDICAYTVSSHSRRCLLEMELMPEGRAHLSCVTSELVANNLFDWIETETCINDCGLHRMSIGLAPEAIMEKLCSADCLEDCPNIADYFSTLAAEEGINMANVCEVQSSELLSDLSWDSGNGIEDNDSWILASKQAQEKIWQIASKSVSYAAAPSLASQQAQEKTWQIASKSVSYAAAPSPTSWI